MIGNWPLLAELMAANIEKDLWGRSWRASSNEKEGTTALGPATSGEAPGAHQESGPRRTANRRAGFRLGILWRLRTGKR